ncbi:SAM-dependent methyltransferase [Thalassospira sp. MCCC 1A03138]|nr:SAM-dependent methyltransferase [Thalassospira sp. MCCC 1A03138]
MIIFLDFRRSAVRFFLNSLRWLLGKRLPLIARILDPNARVFYSQEGEDAILARLFSAQKNGFYVDVGAHHPRRFSNTFHFYQSGWTGINIEPNPSAEAVFKKQRPRDINLCVGVSDCPEKLVYYEFNDPALNTFDSDLAQSRDETVVYTILTTREVNVERLDSILEKHLPFGVDIDFMSIDVEGLDLKVLMSNDWVKYRPKCVLVECLLHEISFEYIQNSDVYSFLMSKGYVFFAKTYNSFLFVEKKFAELKVLTN